MNKPILFSVIMPTYNRANLIGKAILSVVEQKYANWELLIIDDGSTDNTKDVVLAFYDDRIRYVYQENQERSSARNNGVNLAEGTFVCFLDSDDYYLDNFLIEFERIIKSNDNKDAFYFCNTFCDMGNGDLQKIPGPDESFLLNYDFLLINTIGTPRVCLPATIAKKNLFDLKIKNGEDFELWMRLVNDLEIKYNNVYTQVFIEHKERSINDNSVHQAVIATELRVEVAKKYKLKFTKNAYRYFINQNNLKLARTFFKNNKLACLKFSLKVFLSSSKSKKEAIFMILKSIYN